MGKYKIGDRVTICHNLFDVENTKRVGIVRDMCKYEGREAVIVYVDPHHDDEYQIDIDDQDYWWIPNFFEGNNVIEYDIIKDDGGLHLASVNMLNLKI